MPPSFLLIAGGLIVCLISLFDYLVGENFDLSVFYLIPLSLITWYVGKNIGLVTAFIIALSWGMVDFETDRKAIAWSWVVLNSVVDFALYAVFVLIISYLKELIHKLEEQSNHDPLTGAANRRYFYRAAALEISRCKRYGLPFAVAYADINDFKQVNDTYGHSRGDDLLRRTVSILQKNTRDIDTIARLGGDEFAILLPEITPTSAGEFVSKIKHLLSQLTVAENLPITFSIGVASYVNPPASVDEMIKKADDLMYAVKLGGKDNVVFSTWPE